MAFVMNVNDPNDFTNYLNCMMLNILSIIKFLSSRQISKASLH